MTQDRIIGIVGGGQLARMMYQAGIALGLPLRLLAEGPATSAALVVAGAEVGDYRDPAAVTAFARGCDVVTFDHEHVPAALLRELEASGVRVRPGAAALAHAADKAVMRTRLTELGVPCPVWRIARTPGDLVAFGDDIGWPVIAMTSRGGYDGKGVWKVADAAGAHEPFAGLAEGVVVVAEEFVPFVRELSALVVRRPGGETVAYPVSESVQRDGICHETTTPAPGLSPARAAQITRLLARGIEHEGRAWLQHDFAVDEFADADLRALQIGHDRYLAPSALGGRPHHARALDMVLRLAVAEIQTHHVDTSTDHFLQQSGVA